MSRVHRATSLQVARAVLWQLGDWNLGIAPGHFMTRLFEAASAADPENLARLEEAFPEEVGAWRVASREPWGLEWLRGMVKAEMDHAEAGLDLGVAL